jgi:hypothetical protein
MTQKSSNVPQQLIGFWKVVDGDYPLVDEYRPDGVLVQHIGDRTSDPIPFRVEGDFLISSLEQPDGTTSEQREQFAVSEDRLTFVSSDGSKREFQRARDIEQVSGSGKPWWKFW